MGTRMWRQDPPAPAGASGSPAGAGGLIICGCDPGAARRRRIRAANTERQEWEQWLHTHPARSVAEMA